MIGSVAFGALMAFYLAYLWHRARAPYGVSNG